MAEGRVLVTGSSGHLGEALVRTLGSRGREIVGLDLLDSPFTFRVGSITDRAVVRECIRGAESVLHAATLHKPHVGSHDRRAFIETNVIGTTVLLEEAAAAGVTSFVFTSTTSAFGGARSVPRIRSRLDHRGCCRHSRNIYGVTEFYRPKTCVPSWLGTTVSCRSSSSVLLGSSPKRRHPRDDVYIQ